MLFGAEREISLHRGTERINVTVGVAAIEIATIVRKGIVVGVVEIGAAERLVAIAGAALIRQKKIFGNSVGLVPRPGFVFAFAPGNVVFDGFAWKMRSGHVRSALENLERIRIANIFVRIDQAADDLVVAIGGKTIFVVKIARNGLRVKTIEAENSFANRRRRTNGVSASERGNPLAEGCGGREAGIVFSEIVVWIVEIPTTEFFARSRLAGHLAKRF